MTTPISIPSPREIFSAAWDALQAEFGTGNFTFPKEILWLSGTPGAGKGTHTKTIAAHKGFTSPAIVMSSLFKCPEAQKIINSGGLIDDKTATTLLFKELVKPIYHNGAIVDGYPRTAPQGEILKLLHSKLGQATNLQIVALFVDETTSVRRQVQRARENMAHNAEVERTGMGQKVEIRATDLDPAVAAKRYEVFMAQTYSPLKALASDFQFHAIETTGTIEEMARKIKKELN